MLKPLIGWAAAVVTGAVFGSLVQSQHSVAAIARIHEPVAFGDRLAVIGHDLLHFAPTWGLIVALGLIVAFALASLLGRRWPSLRAVLFPLSGLVAVLTALLVMDAMLPVTIVAAARDMLGQVLLGLGGALSGWVYLRIVE